MKNIVESVRAIFRAQFVARVALLNLRKHVQNLRHQERFCIRMLYTNLVINCTRDTALMLSSVLLNF